MVQFRFVLGAEAGFFIALQSRIVDYLRFDTLSSVLSLLGSVSLVKNNTQLFLTSLPTPSSVGRVQFKIYHRAENNKKDIHTDVLFVILGAEAGFEPRDLRVMSPTSYQAALLRDI